jgi:hypothetical protein
MIVGAALGVEPHQVEDPIFHQHLMVVLALVIGAVVEIITWVSIICCP